MAVATEDVHGFVERGRQEGAEIVAGGEFGDGKGAFYKPTVLAKVSSSMEAAQEEIFGPVGSASPFEDDKDAIRLLVSTSPKPFKPFGP